MSKLPEIIVSVLSKMGLDNIGQDVAKAIKDLNLTVVLNDDKVGEIITSKVEEVVYS